MRPAQSIFLTWSAAATAVVVLATLPARAADLVVLSAAAVKTAVAAVPALLEREGGDHVRFVFGTAGAMRDAAVGGTAFDVVILPPAALGELVKQNLAVAGSETPLGTVLLGAASAADAAAPQVGSIESLKAALQAAPSIGIADPARGATSGKFLDKLFGILGMADVVRPKLKLFPEGQAAMEAVARHEVALGLGQMSEAAPVAGLSLAPLPDAAQLKTTYSGALAARSAHPEAARRLLDSLSSAPVQTAFKANGFDVPPRQ